MAGQRCYIKRCSEDVLQQIAGYLSFQDKARLSLTCKGFKNYHMAGPLEIHLAKQGIAQQRSLRTLIHMLEGMSAEQRFKIRELCMHSHSTGIANVPDSQQHRICRALVSNLTILRLFEVHLRLETLEAPGVELRLEVLDLSGSVLVATTHPRRLLWPLLTSNSPSLRCLILRNVVVYVPKIDIRFCQEPTLEHVVLPRLEELDIVHLAVVGYRLSGNAFLEDHRAGIDWPPHCFLPPQSFIGAPSLTTLRFSLICGPSRTVTASTWEHFAKLRSADLMHKSWQECANYLELLPLSLTEFTVRIWPSQHHRCSRDIYSMAEDFKLIMKAAKAGMRLQKLTLIGFTCYDVDRFAFLDAEGICLAGIRELVLEPCLSEEDPIADTHPVNRLLYIFPHLEKLYIRGQHVASFTLSVPSPLLEELSLNFCPASINVKFANLRSLKLEHRFQMGSARRSAKLHKMEIGAWDCGQLDSLTIVLGSYKKGDVFQVQCKPGTAVTTTCSYPAEEWGEWVIGVRLGAGILGQSGQRPVRFVCASSHGMLTWGLA
ncbi:hypothetical protein COCOBI_11-0670 [Coccomyxa sp. Obi]|nr:hypothetical protein COCOBI_11-0670 [Coccomyxa sp. Obi]